VGVSKLIKNSERCFTLIDSTQYACPGRLNQANLFIKRFGIFFGQCSEICWRLNMFSNIEEFL
jgi:Cytochrome C oxidase subunit II, periplasmic domain